MKFKWQYILIIGLFFAWFFKYFIDLLLGKYGFIISLIAIIIWLFLSLYSIYLILKYLIATSDAKPKVKILWIIIPLLTISLFNPTGIVNWEKLEQDNLLIATYLGTVNCQTVIKLRADNILKMSSYCFGTEHLWGKYLIKNDTIFFELPKGLGYIRSKGSFGILQKNSQNEAAISNICIFYNFDTTSKRCLTFKVIELSTEFKF